MQPDVRDAFCARTDVLLVNAGRYEARAKPCVAVVTCMDALFNVHALLGLNESDAHILRNAGGVVTDDVVRSLAISQRLLENTDVMLIAHADCRVGDAARDVAVEARQGVQRLRRDPTLGRTNDIRGFFFDETTGELRELC
ncbi:carbonic anhydrase [Mycolicibacterium sp. P9-64]|uniref:carbonic anhydrase n=1 Tax=Mycolicibacterium sp. P9-64 TaxID=2024612 RepID=UPI0011EFDEB9|nr:carbonic anhydrase [Mycolicibacterium sp. P9-64]KAA0078903.1 carbonic anhydrase [Mycolicibacterium sp. P9-64]